VRARREEGQPRGHDNNKISAAIDGQPGKKKNQKQEEERKWYMITMTTTTQTPNNSNKGDSIWVQVSPTLPSLQECHDFCVDPSCGAVSSFVGITRDNFDGKRVKQLWYEGYQPMAEKELTKLCRHVMEHQGIVRVVAVHKIGDCPVGDASVMLMCASPHRQNSLQACHYLINELKATVPIWKREIYENDPDGVWKENIEWKEGKARRVMVRDER
jgi:molybdopterin synthase catalytic subunit